MKVINSIKGIYSKYINEPKDNVLSSQTLYEALLANLNMYRSTKDDKFLKEASNIGNIICTEQLPNGGFDIGYNFYFGADIKKKKRVEATTPEILSVYALIELYKSTKELRIKTAIDKGMEWLKEYVYCNEEGYYVIPYAPHTINNVHITNCISFCIGTIANYLSVFHDDELTNIYHSMCGYMRKELIEVDKNNAYWLYFEKKYRGAGELYSKIDNYHMAQQLYYHIIANTYVFNDDNDYIVKSVGNYLTSVIKKNVLVPYMVFLESGRKTENYDIWGYSSLLLALLKINEIEYAQSVKRILIETCWNDEYFAPSIASDCSILDDNYYPRSDAWVLHALSESFLLDHDDLTKEIVCKGLYKLIRCKYKGQECHALTWRKEMGRRIKRIYGR